jgi:hypothetical protein
MWTFNLLRRKTTMWQKASVFLTAAILTAGTVRAEDPAVAAVYGKGVHAYYAGGYQQSFDSLSRVVKLGTRDPRVYYFRGLAALQLSRRDEAVADFTKGAELEAEGWSVRTVSRSLERVQGADRLLLERSRQATRLAIAQQMAADTAGVSRIPRAMNGRRYSGIGGQVRPGPKPAEDTASSPSTSEPHPLTSKPPAVPEFEEPKPVVGMASDKESDMTDPFGGDPFADEPDSSKQVSPVGDAADEKKPIESDPENTKPTFSPSEDDPFNFSPKRNQ